MVTTVAACQALHYPPTAFPAWDQSTHAFWEQAAPTIDTWTMQCQGSLTGTLPVSVCSRDDNDVSGQRRYSWKQDGGSWSTSAWIVMQPGWSSKTEWHVPFFASPGKLHLEVFGAFGDLYSLGWGTKVL